MLTKLSPELLHNVSSYLDTDGLQALNGVCRQMRAHLLSLSTRDHINRALFSIGTEYATLGYAPTTAALELADALNVAWQKSLAVMLCSTDYALIDSYYTALGQGGWVMLEWLITWRRQKLLDRQRGENPGFWFSMTRRKTFYWRQPKELYIRKETRFSALSEGKVWQTAAGILWFLAGFINWEAGAGWIIHTVFSTTNVM
ncbi:hypothetical protein FN846DRAFT_903425 [Sphaerosporella brunnea]|uniref:F-box domain-containing protein n=1 Tax=Sphaerosporella brunnea TaxID=1250544 RepID=A0A5J5F761_9PEZI|nr:hypothetical protein FN846DRAFT_903425 [Sphaerosporella brunnea]